MRQRRQRQSIPTDATTVATVPAVEVGSSHINTAAQRRLGDVLVERGLISRGALEHRLGEAARTGTRLGRVLAANGDVKRQSIFDALSSLWGVPAIDLMTQRCEPVNGINAAQLLIENWVPVRVDGNHADVAVCDRPTPELHRHVSDTLDVTDVSFHVTTDWDIEQAVLTTYEDQIGDLAAHELAESRPDQSSVVAVITWQKILGLAAVAAVAALAVADWRAAVNILLVAFNLAFAAGIVFKLVTCTAGARALRANGVHERDTEHRPGYDIADADLPRYTILVPAYHEANVVAQVVEHVTALDYPLSKLQVLVLMEPDDTETVAAARAAEPPDFVRLVVVPEEGPQTKPKACNVGLALADGEYLVIYDAEDRPEPGQLREAVAAFRDADDDIVCVQARLNYFNTRTNFLTRMFTLEYSTWFDYMLPGLDRLRLPIPLGGTSNHFNVAELRRLGGWDPYNVTEDADLGLRAAADGKRVGIIASTTWEEACSEWKAWIRQRTRWIKGYMVTAAVHLRKPVTTWRNIGLRGYVGLIGLIAGTPALFLAAPVVWAFFLYTFLGGIVPGFELPGWLKVVTTITLIGGNLSMIVLSALSARRRRNNYLIGFAVFNPAYWVLHSIAAWRALYQLVVEPSVWEKTPHGIEHGPETVTAKDKQPT